MLKHVKENDDTLKKKTVILEKIKENTKLFKQFEKEVKTLE